jgi:hypothetical protein
MQLDLERDALGRAMLLDDLLRLGERGALERQCVERQRLDRERVRRGSRDLERARHRLLPGLCPLLLALLLGHRWDGRAKAVPRS